MAAHREDSRPDSQENRASAARATTRAMLFRCAVVLGLLGALTVASHLVLWDATRGLQDNAAMFTAIARQRMRILRGVLLAERLALPTNELDRARLEDEIRELVETIDSAQRDIVHGNEAIGIQPPRERSREIDHELSRGVDERIAAFSTAIRSLARTADLPSNERDERVARVIAATQNGALLDDIGLLVNALETEGRERFGRLLWTESAILAVMIMSLAMAGGGVFWPMMRRVRDDIEWLDASNRKLDRRAREADQTAEELRALDVERRERIRIMAGMMRRSDEERQELEREIESRQRAQAALDSSEQRFWAVVEAAPAGLLLVDAQGRIILVNAETERLFGYHRDELLGQEVELLVPERFRERHPEYRTRYLNNPEPRKMEDRRELFGLRKDGSEFPIEIGLTPIHAEKRVFVLSAIVDITQRKKSGEEIRRINAQLRERNEELQQFVYTVSHDLKSPLVTCKGFVGMLRRDLEDGQWDNLGSSLDRIEAATVRMGRCIEDLLYLSRIGTIRNQPEEVDVSSLAAVVVEDMEEAVRRAGARVLVEESLPAAWADRERLREVLENLVGNAIKYGCDGPEPAIHVGGEEDGRETRYFVRDNGKGIAKEHHQRIFGLFQRLESDKNGTGIGLAAVARIAQVHGGRAWVESELHQGATFWISLPKAAPSRGTAPPADSADATGAATPAPSIAAEREPEAALPGHAPA
jgi:two-component system sensor kinase FixL